MNIDRYHVVEPYFGQIKSGQKKFEIRSSSSRMAIHVNVGGVVTMWTGIDMHNPDDMIGLVCKSKTKFASVAEAIEQCGIENVLPGVEASRAIEIYKGFGVVGKCIAFEFKKQD